VFNTETAEQLNSWLSGFEPQLRQMSDVNHDFFVHVLMMIYAERVQKQVEKKDLGLSEEFWAEATGVYTYLFVINIGYLLQRLTGV
jgi:hypothetical protein